MKINEITPTNKSLLALRGESIDGLYETAKLTIDTISLLINASNSSQRNNFYLSGIDAAINEINIFLQFQFEEPDVDIENAKLALSQKLEEIQKLMEVLKK